MATTHALYGMAVGAVTLSFAPEYAPAAMAVGFVAGLFPDLDVYADHRRTLHYPVYCSLLAVPTAVVAVFSPSLPTVGVATALVAVAVHAVMDVGGGGLSLQPWVDSPDRAVYSHFHGRWVPPRRLVAYDGSPGDFLLSLGAAVPLLVVTDGPLRSLVIGTVGVSAGYVLVRKRLVDILRVVIHALPARLRVLVPRRLDHLTDRE